MKIVFTKNEMDILLHRAEMTDCLGEVWAHTQHSDAKSDEEFNRAIDEGQKAAEEVLLLLKRGEMDFSTLTPIQKFVVEDWLDGCTYFGNMDDAVASGELTRQKETALRMAGDSLVEKFARAGIKVSIPRN